MPQLDLAKVVDQIDALGAIDSGSADPRSTAARHTSDMCDLLCESSGASRPDTLHWLFHTANGRSLLLRSLGKRLERTKTQKEKQTMVSLDATQWGIIAKGAPLDFVAAVEKGIVTGDPYALTNAAAKAAHPDMSADRAFAKFTSDHPVLQKYAFAPVDPYSYMRSEPLHKVGAPEGPTVLTTPVYSGGEEGSRTRTSTDRSPDDPSIGRVGASAIDQLEAMCREQLKRRGLNSSNFARVFAEIYSDPSNAQLARQERAENRPGGVERAAT